MRLIRKIGYGLGEMGLVIPYFAIGFYFLYYLTDIVKLDPFLAGVVIFVGKFWDAAFDPFMGVISDRTKSRFGKKRAYFLFGAVPFGISFILLWLIPPNINTWIKFGLALLAFLLYATAYSICEIPYTAMVPIMTKNYDTRTQIVGIKSMLSTLGTIVGGAVALIISSVSNEVLALRIMAIGFGVLCAGIVLIAAFSVKDIENETEEYKIADFTWKEYVLTLKDKNFLVLLFMKMISAIGTACIIAALPYFAEYILGDEGISSIGLAIYVATAALSIPVWNILTKKYDKRRLILIGCCIFAAILVPIAFVITVDLALYFYLGCGILGIFMGSYLLIVYSLIPDMVDYYEHTKGERHESIFFGIWNTSHQIGSALAGLILGSLLKVFNYDANLISQPDSALLGIKIIFGIVPGVFLIIAMIIVQFYGITRQVYTNLIKSEIRINSKLKEE